MRVNRELGASSSACSLVVPSGLMNVKRTTSLSGFGFSTSRYSSKLECTRSNLVLEKPSRPWMTLPGTLLIADEPTSLAVLTLPPGVRRDRSITYSVPTAVSEREFRRASSSVRVNLADHWKRGEAEQNVSGFPRR